MKDIKILAVDTTGKTLAISILNNDKPMAVCNKDTGLTHSEVLMPEIIKLLDEANLKIDDIDYFACSNGPGSFTGLRIGISTLKGLAYSQNKPMVEVGTLDALYKNNEDKCSVICPIIDARREEVYCAVFKDGEKILNDTSMSLIKLSDFLKTLSKSVMFCGDGAVNYRDKIVEYMGDKAIFPNECDMLQNGVSIGLLGYEKIKADDVVKSGDFKVNYLKPSQPEMQMNISVK